MLAYATLSPPAGQAVALIGATADLITAEGLVGLPGVRSVVAPRPNGHGSVNRTKRLSDRIITLKGEVWGGDAAGAYAEFDKLQTALYASVAQPATLRYQRAGGGAELETEVRLDSDVKAPLAGLSSFITWEVQLRASDPRAYSQYVYVATSAPMGASGGGGGFPVGFPSAFVEGAAGRAVLLNPGSTDTPPILRLHGRLVNPTVELEGYDEEGYSISLNGTVARGDFMELDAAAKSIRLNGEANRLYMRDYAASRWFDLPGGQSVTVRLLADEADTDAYLEVFYRHAYG